MDWNSLEHDSIFARLNDLENQVDTLIKMQIATIFICIVIVIWKA